MCYNDNDRPPLPPEGATSGAASGEDLVLTSTDGTLFSAYEAKPSTAASAQVLIYPDVRGLHPFYKDLALRLAEVGYAALAIDYFGRTAGVAARDEGFEWQPHVAAMTLPGVLADTRAGLAYLRRDGGEDRATFIVGFCRGGTLALYAATEDFGVAGIVPFYAGLSRALDPERGTPVDTAPQVRTAVLGLFGGDDPGIPPEQVQALDEALDRSGAEHTIVVYPNAPHSFFDRKAESYAEASRDAWQRLLGFMGGRAAGAQAEK